MTTALWLKNPVSRRIVQPLYPLEINAYWDKPKVAFDKDVIEINVELNGGAHQALTGHILTIEGEVSTKKAFMLDIDEAGRPFVHTQRPTSSEISLNELKAIYKGGRFAQLLDLLGDNYLSDQLAKLDISKELTLLRPLLSIGVLKPLADIPLTYAPRSLSLAEQTSARGNSTPYVEAKAGLCTTPDIISLGFMLSSASNGPLDFSSLLPEKSKYNAALGISPQGLNTLLERLCAAGQARGSMKHKQWEWIDWEWESLTCTFLQNAVQIIGVLLYQGKREVINAVKISCKLDRKGRLQCALLSPQSDSNIAELLLEAWSVVLYSLFYAQSTQKTSRNAYDQKKLIQCFEIPCTKITVEAVASELQIGNDQFVLFYTIPLSLTGFQAEIPLPKPTVVVTQPIIPRQAAPETPVTIQLQAKIIKPSSPPYDYAWTTGRLSEPQSQHTATFSTTVNPPMGFVIGKGAQHLINVTLKVIDMFGQVTEVQKAAKYIPYEHPKKVQQVAPKPIPQPRLRSQSRPQPKKGPSKGGCLSGSLIWLIIIIVRIVIASNHPTTTSPPISPPHPSVTIYFSGDSLSGQLEVSTINSCGVTNGTYTVDVTGNINATTYQVTLTIYSYTSPNQYGMVTGLGNLAGSFVKAVNVSNNEDAWNSLDLQGSITVNSDEKSGSVSTSVRHIVGIGQISQVTGSWTC